MGISGALSYLLVNINLIRSVVIAIQTYPLVEADVTIVKYNEVLNLHLIQFNNNCVENIVVIQSCVHNDISLMSFRTKQGLLLFSKS